MANCDCCGCVFESDYGTSFITGSGSSSDPYAVSKVEPTWTRPAVRVRRTTNQSITSSTTTFVPITFDTMVFDSANFWVVASPTRLTVPVTGLYLMGGCGQWAANATGTRELAIRVNGATIIQINDQAPDSVNGAGTSPWHAINYQYRLGAGDYIELVVRQESGGALNIQPEADDAIVFWAVYAGRTI